jgi:imidazolonepropionase-like amidohydrolase
MTCSHLDLILPKAALRPNPMTTGDGPWELRKLARLNVRQGADVIKACASGGGGTDNEDPDIRNMTYEELEAIVDEAHALAKPCAVHCYTPEAQMNAVKAKVDTIEHMVFHTEESLTKIKEAGTWMIPTLLHRTDHSIEIRRETGTAEFVLDKMKKIQPYAFNTFQACHKMGINIACGTDMQLEPGMGTNAQELEIYVQLGMTPMEAILTATRNAAIAIGKGSTLGTIEKDKLADIVIVDGNPLDDIRVLQERERIVTVMKEGDVYIDRRKGQPRKEVVHAKPDSWRKFDA